MDFKQWIKRDLDKDTPIGDLARDIYLDDHFPITSEYEVIANYLLEVKADVVVLRVFDEAYQLYK